MHYHIMINIKNSVVKHKKRIIIFNTLSQSKIEKFISKVWKIQNIKKIFDFIMRGEIFYAR